MEQRNATCSNVSGTASSTAILSESKGRKGWSVFNDSSAILYLKFGTTASATSYTVKLEPGDFYESPEYYANGRVDGIWSSATGTARVTEII